jgi:putative ABC transport system permease protein
VLVASASWTLPRPALMAVGLPELAIGLALAIGTAVGASTVPAWMAVRSDLLGSLRATTSVTAPRGTRFLRDGLIAIEVMLAVTILAAAGLLINSFARVVSLPMGFDVNGLVVAEIPVASNSLQSEASRHDLMQKLRGALIAEPGVRDVAFADSMPYTSGFMGGATLRSSAGDERRAFFAYHSVSGEYFDTFRIPLRRGRRFAATDVAGGEIVAIVNEQFVREFMPVGEIIGARMRSGRRELTVVGVVGDTRNGDVTRPPRAAVYWPLSQQAGMALRVAVRGAPDYAVESHSRSAWACRSRSRPWPNRDRGVAGPS